MKYDNGMSNPIAAAIRRARLEQGLTAASLAERVGHSQPFITRFEIGERDLKLGDVVALANAVGLEIVARPANETVLSPADRELVDAFTRVLLLADPEEREIYKVEFALREKLLKRRAAAQQ